MEPSQPVAAGSDSCFWLQHCCICAASLSPMPRSRARCLRQLILWRSASRVHLSNWKTAVFKSSVWVLLSFMFTKKKKKPQPNASFAHLCHIRHLHKLGPCLHIIMAACRFVASTFTDHLSRFGSQRKVCLPVFLRSSLSLDIWLINWIHFKSLRSRFIKCSFWKVYLLWTFFGYLICQSLSTFSSSLH